VLRGDEGANAEHAATITDRRTKVNRDILERLCIRIAVVGGDGGNTKIRVKMDSLLVGDGEWHC